MSESPDSKYDALLAMPEAELNPSRIFDYLIDLSRELPESEHIRVWDGKMAAKDLARMLYGCSKDRSGEIMRDLVTKEVRAICPRFLQDLDLHQFPGHGQVPVPVVTQPNSILFLIE